MKLQNVAAFAFGAIFGAVGIVVATVVAARSCPPEDFEAYYQGDGTIFDETTARRLIKEALG